MRKPLLLELLDGTLQGRGIHPHNRLHHLAILVEHEKGHGGDCELLGEVGELVDVEFEELDVPVLFGVPDRPESISSAPSLLALKP